MNLGPGSSAILDLKAELLRKKNQVETKSKSTEKVEAFTVRKGGFKVERREAKEPRKLEAPPPDDEEELKLQESRRRLEEKARLYDMHAAQNWTEETDETLVDFNQKRRLEKRKREEQQSDDESDWVTFVDSLGRTRKCLKSDLDHYLREDGRLREDLQPNQTQVDLDDIPLPEQQIDDLAKKERELKWNQIEEENKAKGELHYRDVLFDEIREHGQAHFEFSRDDTERAHQLKILERLREDTTNAQKMAQSVKRRREEALKERMRRIRERKGLPPEETEEETQVDQPPPPPPPPPAEVRPSSSHIRAWDVGKEVHGVPIRAPPRRSYVEERRAERPSEFAPPSTYEKHGWKKQTETKSNTESVDDFLSNIRNRT